MDRHFYYVVTYEERWKIFHQGTRIGSYDTKQLATDAGIDMAQGSGERGHPSELLVEGDDHRFSVQWTYGTDLYPRAA